MLLHTFTDLFSPILSAQFLSALVLAILFIQSGMDKVLDWKGNLEWLTGHFAKSPLASMVPFMLGTITLFELAAGFLSLAGVVSLALSGSSSIALVGAQLSCLSLTMLFFGQRIAKDYGGAASLIPYILLSLLSIGLQGWS